MVKPAIHLSFGSVNDRVNSRTVGPAACFRIGGNFIREDQGEVVASYKNHCWIVGDSAFSRYECKRAVVVHFEDTEGGKSEQYGPFDSPWVADGSAYCQAKLFAKFMDTTLLWHDHETDTFWPWMVWSPVPDSDT